jgi:hypothetical protein
MKRRSFFKWLAAPFAGAALLKVSNVAEAMPALPEARSPEIGDDQSFEMTAPMSLYVNGVLHRPGEGHDYVEVPKGFIFERKLRTHDVLCYSDVKTRLWATLDKSYKSGEKVSLDLFKRI